MRTSDRVLHKTLGYGTVIMLRPQFEFNILILLDTTLQQYWVRERDLEVVKTLRKEKKWNKNY
jgi:hypothetical protein